MPEQLFHEAFDKNSEAWEDITVWEWESIISKRENILNNTKKPQYDQNLATQIQEMIQSNYENADDSFIENKSNILFKTKTELWELYAWLPNILNNTTTQPEQLSWITEHSHREKIVKYAEISDLAYAVFHKEWSIFDVKDVNLDPLWIDLRKLFENGHFLHTVPPQTLNADEKAIHSIIQQFQKDWLSNNNNTTSDTDKNIQEIISLWLRKLQVLSASLEPDIGGNIRSTDTPEWMTSFQYEWLKSSNEGHNENISIVEEALKKLKQRKAKQMRENLKQITDKYEILETFPWDWPDRPYSWLNCVLLEDKKDGKKYLSIAWSQFESWSIQNTDLWDYVWADKDLILWKIPEDQTSWLIEFMNKIKWEKLAEWEKIRIVWHSLGWTLSQIWTSMFPDIVDESYTFNAPWAKKLEVNEWHYEWDQLAYIQAFQKNRDKNEVWELLTNVKATEDTIVSLIPKVHNVDIWNYTIELKWWSHSLDDVIDLLKNSEIVIEVIDRKEFDEDRKNEPPLYE